MAASSSNVYGAGFVTAVTYTRPSNTTAYAANDTIADSTSAPTVLTIADAARATGSFSYITKARIVTDQSTCTARFRLHLYSVSPTAINDNDPYTLLWSQRASYVGNIAFGACATEGTGSTAAQDIVVPGSGNLPLAFITASTDRQLYAILETIDAFTPASGQNFYIELDMDVL